VFPKEDVMGRMINDPDRRGQRSGRDRERRDERWNRYFGVSMGLAVAFHAAVFTFWPSWEATVSRAEQRAEMIQIEPVAMPGESFAPGDVEIVAEHPGQQERPAKASSVPQEAELRDLARLDQLLAPRIVGEVAPYMAYDWRTPPQLILETMVAFNPVTDGDREVVWPTIRNPNVLTRFLSSRYNPIRPAVEGFVSIAMWIDDRGIVGWTEVRESSGSEELDLIALSAFNDVVAFSPARSKGSAVPVTVVISVPFTSAW